jgi:hypothetical protein
MPVRKPRLAVAGIIAATAIAVPGAALASGLSTASGKPGPSPTASAPAASKSPAPGLSPTGTKSPAPNPSAAASKSASAQSPQAGIEAERLVTALATQLGISDSAAQHVLNQLEDLGRGGVDPGSPAFAAIARSLGVTPAQLAAARVTRGEREVTVTRTEYLLLELFLRNPGRVLSHSQIFQAVWGYDFGLRSDNLWVYMSYLRTKLEAAGEPRILHTVRGLGYVLRDAP